MGKALRFAILVFSVCLLLALPGCGNGEGYGKQGKYKPSTSGNGTANGTLWGASYYEIVSGYTCSNGSSAPYKRRIDTIYPQVLLTDYCSDQTVEIGLDEIEASSDLNELYYQGSTFERRETSP